MQHQFVLTVNHQTADSLYSTYGHDQSLPALLLTQLLPSLHNLGLWAARCRARRSGRSGKGIAFPVLPGNTGEVRLGRALALVMVLFGEAVALCIEKIFAPPETKV